MQRIGAACGLAAILILGGCSSVDLGSIDVKDRATHLEATFSENTDRYKVVVSWTNPQLTPDEVDAAVVSLIGSMRLGAVERYPEPTRETFLFAKAIARKDLTSVLITVAGVPRSFDLPR